MATFLMFGCYDSKAADSISSGRTKKASDLIAGLGGKVQSMYATLGKNDLLLIVDFPDVEHAIKASVALHKLTGISFSTTEAITVDEFDKLMSEG